MDISNHPQFFGKKANTFARVAVSGYYWPFTKETVQIFLPVFHSGLLNKRRFKDACAVAAPNFENRYEKSVLSSLCHVLRCEKRLSILEEPSVSLRYNHLLPTGVASNSGFGQRFTTDPFQ